MCVPVGLAGDLECGLSLLVPVGQLLLALIAQLLLLLLLRLVCNEREINQLSIIVFENTVPF